MEFENLPDCVLLYMFLMLSVRELFVLKCVSHRCEHIISSIQFGRIRFNQRPNSMLVRSGNEAAYSGRIFLLDQKDFQSWTGVFPFGFPLLFPGKHLHLINSCNGIVYLEKHFVPALICNPITREFITLSPSGSRWVWGPTCSGFGVSAVTNTYKVLRLCMHMDHEDSVVMAAVLTVGLDTWRGVHAWPNASSITCPTYLNGFIYFLGYGIVDDMGFVRYVYGFEIENEKFHLPIEVPTFADNDDCLTSLKAIGDRLVLCSSGQSDEVHVWTMNPNDPTHNWSSLITYSDPGDAGWATDPYAPLMFLSDGSLLSLHCRDHSFIATNPRDGAQQTFMAPGFRSTIEAITHVESLIPMDVALAGHGDGVTVHHY